MKEQSSTDQQLALRAKQGDKRAFDLLVLKYQHKILGVVRRYIHDFQEAQDATQDAFIKAYTGLPGFRGDSAFYTWLYRIAVNTAKNYLSKLGKRLPVSSVDIQDAENFKDASALRSNESSDAELIRSDLKNAIFQAIAELPENLRITITLRELDGFSYHEIAEITQCPVGTVRSRIFRPESL